MVDSAFDLADAEFAAARLEAADLCGEVVLRHGTADG